MRTIEQRVAVTTAPERVYRYLEDERHLLELCGLAAEDERVESLEHVPGRRLVDRLHGRVDARLAWELLPHEGVTEVDLTVDGRGLDDRGAEAALRRLKRALEA